MTQEVIVGVLKCGHCGHEAVFATFCSEKPIQYRRMCASCYEEAFPLIDASTCEHCYAQPLVTPVANDDVWVSIEVWLHKLPRYIAWARDGYPRDERYLARERAA